MAHVLLSLTPASLIIITFSKHNNFLVCDCRCGRYEDDQMTKMNGLLPGSSPAQNNPQDRGLHSERQHSLVFLHDYRHDHDDILYEIHRCHMISMDGCSVMVVMTTWLAFAFAIDGVAERSCGKSGSKSRCTIVFLVFF